MRDHMSQAELTRITVDWIETTIFTFEQLNAAYPCDSFKIAILSGKELLKEIERAKQEGGR